MHHGVSMMQDDTSMMRNRMSPSAPSALHVVSATGSKRLVQIFLEAGADVKAQCGEYGNALIEASRSGHDTIVQELLVAGADVNAQGEEYEEYGNALQAASYVGRYDCSTMLEGGADVNAQGRKYGDPLQTASCWGHDIIVQRLIESKEDVTLKVDFLAMRCRRLHTRDMT